MTTIDDAAPSSPGEALVRELQWVHGLIRRDLDFLQQLSSNVLAGAPPNEVKTEIGRLQTTSPLWRLRVNCLHYCRFVHSHHSLEDVALFPELRRANPALAPVVDKLEADHRLVSDYLDEIEVAANHLTESDTTTARRRVVDSLAGLSEHLLAHLAFEEVEISPTLLQWETWPGH